MIFNLINNLINLNNEVYYSTIENQIYKIQSRKHQAKIKNFKMILSQFILQPKTDLKYYTIEL